MDPDLTKDKWSCEDNMKLFELHKSLGSKWKEISEQFIRRTDNGIKNQFFSIIRKSLRKACKYCGLLINPSTINTIKPKILSQFVNNEFRIEDCRDLDFENQKIEGLIGDETGAHKAERRNSQMVRQYESEFLSIPEIISKFAFSKPNELKPEIKDNLKSILMNSLKLLQSLK